MKKCCECDKMFSTLCNLRRHAKKFHPDKVDDVAAKKKFMYRCESCRRNFNLLRDFTYHNKRMHSTEDISKKSTVKFNCPLCQFNDTKAKLFIHFETEHDVQIKTDIFEFNSADEFIDWKNKLENSTQAQYVKQTGNSSTNNNKTIIKYVCHRSGYYIPKGKKLRHLKTQGSRKINAFCPACMKVEIKNNKYRVSLNSQHIGHQHDLKHLSLTSEEREKLAIQMALQIPFDEILDRVRNSMQGSQLERIHLLSKRDLYNIEKSFNLQSTVIRHKNDDAQKDVGIAGNSLLIDMNLTSEEVDGNSTGLDEYSSSMSKKETKESGLTKKKEKMITNSLSNIKNVENISCIEQVDEIKELCAPVAPALSVIASSHEELGKPDPSENSFGSHNKTIIPQRGKQHFTRNERENRVADLAVSKIQEKRNIALLAILDHNYYWS